MSCKRCRLSETRRCITVPWYSSPARIPCDIVFICEGPSKVGEMFGHPMGGQELKLLNSLMVDAQLEAKQHVSYMITSMILCRATDEKNGEGRAARSDEILACQFNFLRSLPSLSKRVVFIGKSVQKFYKKQFPYARMIQHPSFLMKQGESWRTLTARILCEVIREG